MKQEVFSHLNYDNFYFILLVPVKIYQYPPAILQASENDSNYNISCYASGSPEPRILWLKNGVAVSFTELYRIRNVAINSSAVLSTLELKVVNKIDHANWSCQASNVLVGNQSTFDIATTLLNVACKLNTKAFLALEVEQNYTVMLGLFFLFVFFSAL